jgi:DNA-binding transcriptional regulator YdaS (Cro superfamily)
LLPPNYSVSQPSLLLHGHRTIARWGCGMSQALGLLPSCAEQWRLSVRMQLAPSRCPVKGPRIVGRITAVCVLLLRCRWTWGRRVQCCLRQRRHSAEQTNNEQGGGNREIFHCRVLYHDDWGAVCAAALEATRLRAPVVRGIRHRGDRGCRAERHESSKDRVLYWSSPSSTGRNVRPQRIGGPIYQNNNPT